jgi:hypothetical protein
MPLTVLSHFHYLNKQPYKKETATLTVRKTSADCLHVKYYGGGDGLSNVSRDVTRVGIISSVTLETTDCQASIIIAALHDEAENNGTTPKGTQSGIYFPFITKNKCS